MYSYFIFAESEHKLTEIDIVDDHNKICGTGKFSLHTLGLALDGRTIWNYLTTDKAIAFYKVFSQFQKAFSDTVSRIHMRYEEGEMFYFEISKDAIYVKFLHFTGDFTRHRHLDALPTISLESSSIVDTPGHVEKYEEIMEDEDRQTELILGAYLSFVEFSGTHSDRRRTVYMLTKDGPTDGPDTRSRMEKMFGTLFG